MASSTGDLSGSCCETHAAEIGQVPAEGVAGGASASSLSENRGFERAESAWIASIDEALLGAKTQLAEEFSLWKRLSTLGVELSGVGGASTAIDHGLAVALQISGMDWALALRPTGTGGCTRVTNSLHVPAGLVRSVDGFADGGAGIFGMGREAVVVELESEGGCPPDLLFASLAQAGVRSLVCVPMRTTAGKPIGQMVFLALAPPVLEVRTHRMLLLCARIIADVVERLEAGELAARSAREIRAVLDTVTESIVTIDADGLVHTANPATEHLFGYAPDELVGRPVSLLVPQRDCVRLEAGMAHHRSGASSAMFGRTVEVTGRRKDGSELQVELVVSEIEHGRLYSGVMRDITERKANESRLRQSDRMASLGTLAAGLGHDMNNVLFPIRAHLNALAGDAASRSDDRASAHLGEIRTGIDYLQKLADGLHYLVHDAGHADGGMDGARLFEWWQGTGPLLTRALPALTQVHVSIPESLPRVRASEHALTQAVLNVIVNAGEAMQQRPEGGPGHVAVTAHAAPDGTAILLSVSDDGPGMPESVRRRAFDLFFTTKTRGMGTGLGLAMVQRVAQEAGGSAWIDSEPGKGTTVTLRLPVACEATAAAGIPVAVSVADGRAAAFVRSALAGRGFAVVDDPADAQAWLVDPRIVDAAEARTWVAQHPRGTLVLSGRPHALNAAPWRGLAAGSIEQTKDFDALLVGVDRLCTIIMGRVDDGRGNDDRTGSGTHARKEEGSKRRNGTLAGGRARARGG